MCGIAGFAGRGDLFDLQRMNSLQSYRGPDDEGCWQDSDARVFLGHRRLSILDVVGGRQPMWTADGLLGIVFNGEIYNFDVLREELTKNGHRFATDHSDTEVLLHAYREWGEELTSRLNGMWAFVIYDKAKKKLFASRDRFGEKPFYYTLQDDTFVFASELKSVVAHPNISANLSMQAIRKYFGYGFIPAPFSIYENIFKLPAGNSLRFDLSTRQLKTWEYWSFEIEETESRPEGIEDRWIEELRSLLSSSVKKRLVCDVPVGVFLSGGVDSSAVSALTSRILGRGRFSTFSLGFDEDTFDESAFSSAVAAEIGSNHHAETLSLERAVSVLPELVSRLDEPLGDASILPTYFLCQFASKSVKVALGGDGADELFAGYAPFHALKWAKIYSSVVPRPIHGAIKACIQKIPVSHGYMSLDFKLKKALGGMDYPSKFWNPAWMSTLDLSEMGKLFSGAVDLEDVFSDAIEIWDRNKNLSIENQTIQFFTRLYLQNGVLTKVDRASMLNSIEVRAPFLDLDVVNFARRLPYEFKYRRGTSKYLLKKAMRGIVPNQVLTRSKQGFGVPVGKWFKDGKLNFGVHSDRLFNSSFSHGLLQQHMDGKQDYRGFLWNQWALAEFMGVKR